MFDFSKIISFNPDKEVVKHIGDVRCKRCHHIGKVKPVSFNSGNTTMRPEDYLQCAVCSSPNWEKVE